MSIEYIVIGAVALVSLAGIVFAIYTITGTIKDLRCRNSLVHEGNRTLSNLVKRLDIHLKEESRLLSIQKAKTEAWVKSYRALDYKWSHATDYEKGLIDKRIESSKSFDDDQKDNGDDKEEHC